MTLWEYLAVIAPHQKNTGGSEMSDERARELGLIGFD